MHVIFLNPQGNFDQNDSYLTEHADFGGQLVYMKEVCMALSKMGVKVDIVTRRIADPDWPEFSKTIDYYEGFEDNLRIVRVQCGGPLFLKKELLWYHLDEFTNNIISFYGDDLPDFATAHYGDGGYCGMLLKVKTRLNFTFTSHSLGAQKLDKLVRSIDKLEAVDKEYQFSKRIFAERLSMIYSYKIITSTSQERYEQYSHPLYRGAVEVHDDNKFSVIPPGVNTRLFNTEDSTGDDIIYRKIEKKIHKNMKPFIIVSSRLDHKKNHMGVVKAFALSKELQKKANLAIFIRGIEDPYKEIGTLSDGEQKILQAILDIIVKKKIKNKVFFFNIQSQPELATTYRYFSKLGSVFALTAFYEPFGLAPIEAAASGLAIVATQHGGPSEIFEDGSGILVDPNDERDIAAGLINAVDEYQYYADKGKKRVQEKYTWEKTAEGYLKVIEEGVRHTFMPRLNAKNRILDYLVSRQASKMRKEG